MPPVAAGLCFDTGVHSAVFQRRGCAEDPASAARRVLQPGQFDHDARITLLRDDRFGHAERVDAVAQRAEVLLDRVGRQFAHFLFADLGDQGITAVAAGAVAELQLGVAFASSAASRSRSAALRVIATMPWALRLAVTPGIFLSRAIVTISCE